MNGRGHGSRLESAREVHWLNGDPMARSANRGVPPFHFDFAQAQKLLTDRSIRPSRPEDHDATAAELQLKSWAVHKIGKGHRRLEIRKERRLHSSCVRKHVTLSASLPESSEHGANLLEEPEHGIL